MTAHAKRLAIKRQLLLAQCDAQRQELALLVRGIEERLMGIDNMIGVVRRLLGRPALWISAVAATVIAGRWRLIRMLTRGAMWLSFARKMRHMVAR